MFPRQHFAVLTAAIVSLQVTFAIAQSDNAPVEIPSKKPSRTELRDKQLDVSLEARDIERVLTKVKRASELAKSRVAEAANTTEMASVSLEKGDSKNAKADAQKASAMFKEIITQLEALLAEETPQRVAAGRDLAKRLAEMEKEFADEVMMPIDAAGGDKAPPESKPRPLPGMGGNKGDARYAKKMEPKEGKNDEADPKSNAKPDAGKNGSKGDNTDQKDLKGEGEGKPDPKSQPEGGSKAEGTDREQAEAKGSEKDGQQRSGGSGKPVPRSADGKNGSSGEQQKDGSTDQNKTGGEGADKKSQKETKPSDGAGGTADDKSGSGGANLKEESPKESKNGGGGGDKKPQKETKPSGGAGGPENDKNSGGGGDKKAQEEAERRRGAGGASKRKPMTEEEYTARLARRAEQLEKMGDTLKDVLQAIGGSDDPADKEAAANLMAIVKETNLINALESMKATTEMVRSGKKSDARLASLDLADRLDIVAARLDAAYRSIVAPQVEELRKLEQQLSELREKMEQLETPAQVASLNREIQKAIEEAEKLGISERAREDLLEQIQFSGAGSTSKLDSKWSLAAGRYIPPENYYLSLRVIQEEVQARIQTLLLGDIISDTDEATPPKYQGLVERYYQVLSTESSSGGKKPEIRKPKPAAKNRLK